MAKDSVENTRRNPALVHTAHPELTYLDTACGSRNFQPRNRYSRTPWNPRDREWPQTACIYSLCCVPPSDDGLFLLSMPSGRSHAPSCTLSPTKACEFGGYIRMKTTRSFAPGVPVRPVDALYRTHCCWCSSRTYFDFR